MAHLTRPAVVSRVSAGSFPETAAGNRAYHLSYSGCTSLTISHGLSTASTW